MSQLGPVAVLGATGQVGSAVVRGLSRRGLPVHAIARTVGPDRSATRNHVVPDWNESDLATAFDGCASAFVMVPLTEDAEALGQRVHAALERAAVQRVVRLSVLGGVIDDGLALGRLHGALDRDLMSRGCRPAILRPDSFMQNLLGSAASIAQGQLVNATGEGRMALIDAEDIGECAAALLAGDAAWPDHPMDLTGPELLSHDDIAVRIGRWLKRPVAYEDLSPLALRGLLLEFGLPAFLAEIFSELAAWTRRADRAEQMSDAVPTLLGRPGRRLETFLDAHAASFSEPSP
ncbi:NmrA family NAD(P)-binding protein [Abyssibacter sp.]|jgi:uncharacterized protein YbjT (DUF2867 family)|uniref:NAD(P)H-binding protein n=1 Tax=Abyssibacter sp. TaxID=2320200 RepID=UPI0025C56DE6|nr:NmrA family NAD(P)-binding protein [Abyssibacter sp.]MCK5859199.1 NmrA family NAD(P)-binding protein [Abyssibacter sp.]